MRLVVVDTSAIIASALRGHADIQQLLLNQALNQADLCVTAQTLFEFWSVATRPKTANGFDLSPAIAFQEITKLRSAYRLLDEKSDTVDRWLQLCVDLEVRGRPSHDARIVAVM